MKYCILGAGRTAQGMVAYLSQRGQQAGIWDRSQEKRSLLRECGIKMEGQCEGSYQPIVVDSLEEAAAQAEVLLIMTTAEGHMPLASGLSGHLRKGQMILILNGNMGAWEFWSILQEEIKEKGVLLAETGGMLLLCDYNENGHLFLKSIKKEMNLAAIPSSATAEMIHQLSAEFPQFYSVGSVVETSLNNSNPIIHAPVTLFNFTRTENGENYNFYADGATACVVSFIEQADKERCAVIQAMGATPITCVDIINSFRPRKFDCLLDAIRQNNAYMTGKGPRTLAYRYITEDIPFGIVPLIDLGKQFAVPTPCLEAMLTCYHALLGNTFPSKSPNVQGFAQVIHEM